MTIKHMYRATGLKKILDKWEKLRKTKKKVMRTSKKTVAELKAMRKRLQARANSLRRANFNGDR